MGFRISDDGIQRLNAIAESLNKSRTEVIEYLLISYDKKPEDDSSFGGSFLVSSLLNQLEEKDKQIFMLMEQSRNYQVLLKQEQDNKLLPMSTPKRIGLFHRLFGRETND